MAVSTNDNVVWNTRYDFANGKTRQVRTRYRTVKAWSSETLMRKVNGAESNGWVVAYWNFGTVFKKSALLSKSYFIDEDDEV